VHTMKVIVTWDVARRTAMLVIAVYCEIIDCAGSRVIEMQWQWAVNMGSKCS